MYREKYGQILFPACLFSSSQTLKHVQLDVLLHSVNPAHIHMGTYAIQSSMSSLPMTTIPKKRRSPAEYLIPTRRLPAHARRLTGLILHRSWPVLFLKSVCCSGLDRNRVMCVYSPCSFEVGVSVFISTPVTRFQRAECHVESEKATSWSTLLQFGDWSWHRCVAPLVGRDEKGPLALLHYLRTHNSGLGRSEVHGATGAPSHHQAHRVWETVTDQSWWRHRVYCWCNGVWYRRRMVGT